MPLVRIDLRRGKTPDYRAAVGDVVYDAMVETLGVPVDDRFMVVAEHDDGLVIHPTYLGIERSDDALMIQITLNVGRTVQQKRAFYAAVARGLHERVQLRQEDVVVSLVEAEKENWSFGNGEAQYAMP